MTNGITRFTDNGQYIEVSFGLGGRMITVSVDNETRWVELCEHKRVTLHFVKEYVRKGLIEASKIRKIERSKSRKHNAAV